MRHIEGMTTRFTKVLSAQYSVLSQKPKSFNDRRRMRVRGASWSAPALWGLPQRRRAFGKRRRAGALQDADAPNHGSHYPRTGILNPGHWALSTFVLALLLTLAPTHASAQGLKIQLVSEQTAIVPGKAFTVGLWLQHPEGAHTYWRFPGIVGVPTQMEWQLPPGWTASELIYPEPERTFMYQIKAQGYDRDVMLRTEITPPTDLKPGESVTLTGKASWMCCGNSCHPGAEDLSLALPVAASAELNEKWHALFEAERARQEQPSDAWTASVVEQGAALTLTLKPATPAARLTQDSTEAAKIIVFTEDGWFDSDEPQGIQRHADGSLTLQLTKADAYLSDRPPTTLRAILRNDSGWLQGGKLRCLQISPTIVRAKAGG